MGSTAKTVGIVMSITLFSRMLALFGNIAFMTVFGVGLETDICSYAVNLPNLVFNGFGTALTTTVIPIFAGYLGTGEKERAYRFADIITTFSLLFSFILSLLCILAAPGIMLLLPRFRTENYGLTLFALRVMFPVMLFYALNNILQGILQSTGNFYMPALAAIPGSLIVILYIYLFGHTYGIKGLLIATFAGLSLQALALIPCAYKGRYRFLPSFEFGNDDFKNALKLIPPVLAGASAYQAGMIFNTTLSASFKDSVALLTSVQNIVLYAALIFIYSVTAVLFPRLTVFAARDDMHGFIASLHRSVKYALYFLLPAAAGLIALGGRLTNLLYGWKRITSGNISDAALMMALYAVGIPGIGMKEIADRAFYALKDTKKPALNGIAAMSVNIAAGLLLVSFMGVYGIPLAYSISTLTGGLLALYLIRRKVGASYTEGLAAAALKSAVSSVAMLIVVITLNMLLDGYGFRPVFIDRCIKLFIPAIIGIACYFFATCMLKTDVALELLEKTGRWFKKR